MPATSDRKFYFYRRKLQRELGLSSYLDMLRWRRWCWLSVVINFALFGLLVLAVISR